MGKKLQRRGAQRTETAASARSLVNLLLEEIGTGKTDTARERRGNLLTMLQARGGLSDDTTLVGRVLGSALSLLHFEKREAAEALSPYVTLPDPHGKVAVKYEALEELDSSSPFLAGLIRGEIGNLMHRTWQVSEAEPIARKGLSLLDQRRPELLATEFRAEVASLLAVYARAFWSRLAWQARDREPALRELSRLRTDLTAQRASSDRMGPAINIAKAVVLDLTADCLSLKGDHQKALQVIHGAQSLLEPVDEKPGTGDRIRRAHVLYVAGKLSQKMGSDRQIALVLFARAAQLYPEMHPLALRSINRRARCFIASGDHHGATIELGQLQSKLEEWTLPDDERRYCLAERHLTELYMLEKTAQQSGRQDERDRDRARCLRISEELIRDSSRLPPRLQIEAKLHRGLALVRLSERARDGRDLIEEAFVLGSGGVASPEEVESPACAASVYVALLLAMAEAMKRTGDAAGAQRFWHDASTRLTEMQSPFLRAWAERLSRRFATPFMMTLPEGPMTLKNAEKEFRDRYIRHVVEHLERTTGRAPSGDDLAKTLGYTRQRIGDIAKALGITLQRSRTAASRVPN